MTNVRELLTLEGKVSIITGGAGRYGKHFARGLAEAGAKVWVVSRNGDACAEFASVLRGEGHACASDAMDMTSEDDIRRVRERILAEDGRIDILVNNAVIRPMKSYDDDLDHWRESIDVNSTGMFACTRSFGEVMEGQGSGSIINIASIYGVVSPDLRAYGRQGDDFPPDYMFHRSGVINFTRAMAMRFARFGVRVNALSPGGLDEPTIPAPTREFYEARSPMGRFAGPDDVKGALVFLASDASAYITGQNLLVDGGWTIF
jgi:NAD(P)-dependent dehydrogenase (short-subunit alcohol dehydrogenase family)